jgi:hypothetical protein
VGTFAAFSVATAEASIGFLVSAMTGNRGRAIGVATGIAVRAVPFASVRERRQSVSGVSRSYLRLASQALVDLEDLWIA